MGDISQLPFHPDMTPTPGTPISYHLCDGIQTPIAVFDIGALFITAVGAAFTPYFFKGTKKWISWINCVGAGVLLGTCFFHYMPEVREQFSKMEGRYKRDGIKPNPWDHHALFFEICTCAGFL